MDGFVHLHVHSHYSLLDGAALTENLVAKAKEHGQTAMALTDHGNLFGAMDFYHEAKAAGIKPILGIEAYISPTMRQDRSMGSIDKAAYHLLLLAMNRTGWENIIRLASRAFLEGFYYRPRIDREILSQFNEGVICCSACLGGEIPTALLSNQPAQARKIAGEYLDIFGKDRFFIEIQNQGLADQDKANPLLVELARELGVGLVGTNDVHFLERADKPAHEVLTAISTGKTLADGGALSYPPELYLKSTAEMRQAFAAWPEAADNTLKIAEMCHVDLRAKKHLPVFKTPADEPADQYLTKLAWEGLARRFAGKDIPEPYRTRLEWELKVIADKGYSSYFLIVNDFVQYARANHIPAAPRGSGVATLLGYSLGIADVDPLRYGLLFERFTDPARKEDPDIDIDMCQEGRPKVIQYVREKYGYVAQIITYGTLKARAAIRDVGRAMGVPLGEVDIIARKVPDALHMTLDDALEGEPDLKRMYETEPQVKKLIDFARKLEGLARHAGVHAAGVVVADEPLENLVPLCRQADSTDVITQWDGPTCEKVGLMKMDFLGLRTLTIIQRAADLVAAKTGKPIDPEALPLEDPKVFELFCKGHTDGVFQFESDGMKNVLLQMQPSRIEDLIAANAMYRPGPMELIDTYCSRKAGREPVPSVHALVDGLLAETYGIMVYQEQVMQVLNRLGLLPLNRALTLIKAISKKKEKTIMEERPNFLAGAKQNGIADEESARLFDLILKFAGYGFNKAHSTRYAIVAYQTAWFKVHYPREFLAATLTFESADSEKMAKYMAEATRMKVTVAPPDINACDHDFSVDGDRVRFGLGAVKGVGDKAIGAILESRREVGRFTDLYHFAAHVDLRAVNHATIEALIKCGAFDSLSASRAAMAAALDHAIELGQAASEDRRSGQMNFFGASAAGAAPVRFPKVEPWSEAQLLAAEKETLGFYITSHPLVRYARELDMLSQPSGITLARLEDYGQDAGVCVGCMIAQIRQTVTKSGKSAGSKMAILTVEDLTGKRDAVVFSEAYERLARLIAPDAMVFLSGTIDRRRERPQIIVEDVLPIEQALAQLTVSLVLKLPGAPAADLLERIKESLTRHHGNCPVVLSVLPGSRSDVRVCVKLDPQWFATPNQRLMDELIGLLGEEQLKLHPKPMKSRSNGNGRSWQNRNGVYRQQPLNGIASAAVTRFN